MKRDTWVKVERESELAPGMTVQLRPCAQCGKEARTVLLSFGQSSHGWCKGCGKRDVWEGTHICPSPVHCFCCAIPGGRLYRLADGQFDETVSDTPVLELVGAEERR